MNSDLFAELVESVREGAEILKGRIKPSRLIVIDGCNNTELTGSPTAAVAAASELNREAARVQRGTIAGGKKQQR